MSWVCTLYFDYSYVANLFTFLVYQLYIASFVYLLMKFNMLDQVNVGT